MSKVKDISRESIEIVQLVNKDNLFKVVKVYEYKQCRVLYCVTQGNKLHVSASTPQGPANKEDLMYAFYKLTNKPIKNFKLMKSSRALYLLEKECNYVN